MLSRLARTIQAFHAQFPGEPMPKDPSVLIDKINANYPAMSRALTQDLGGLLRVLRGPHGAEVVDRIERDLAAAEPPVNRRNWLSGITRAVSEGIAGKPASGNGGGAFAGALVAQRLQAQCPPKFHGRDPIAGARYNADKGETSTLGTVLAFAWESGKAGPREVAQFLQDNFRSIVRQSLEKARMHAEVGDLNAAEASLADASFQAGRAGMDIREEVAAIQREAAQAQFDKHFEGIATAIADGRVSEAAVALTRAAYAEQWYNTVIAPQKVEWPSDVPRPMQPVRT